MLFNPFLLVIILESVRSFNDINNLKYNKITGNPELVESTIVFKGNNNVLFCENGVKLFRTNINFEANNSLIYLSSTKYGQYGIPQQIPWEIVTLSDVML